MDPCDDTAYCETISTPPPLITATDRMRLKRRRAHIAIWRTGQNKKKPKQTDGQMDGSQHRLMPPTVGEGNNKVDSQCDKLE